MNPVSLLCEIIGQAGKVAAQTYRGDPRYGALLDGGLIARDGVVQSMICENCDSPHDAQVIVESGSYGHFCPSLGFVRVERTDLVAVRPNFVALAGQLHGALECGPVEPMQLARHTWRIGFVETAGGRAVIYFHPRLLECNDLNDLETALRAEIRREHALVITAVGNLQYRSFITRSLSQLVRMEPNEARLRQLASIADAVGAPPKLTGGRPNLHRERVMKLLAERVTEESTIEIRNREADAILATYAERFPYEQPPARSTVRRYVTEFRRRS